MRDSRAALVEPRPRRDRGLDSEGMKDRAKKSRERIEERLTD